MKKRLENLLKLVPLQLLVISAVFLLCLFIFSFIVYEAVYQQADIFDDAVIRFFSRHASPAFILLMERITFFGSSTFLLPAYVLLVGWHLAKRKFQYAFDIAMIAISSEAMLFSLKLFFHRHRPAMPILKDITGYSFPSGHSFSSFVFCIILIYLVWKGTLLPIQKFILISLLAMCPLLIGLSRVVLNVHYATDVIGGFCMAIMWVLLSFTILQKTRRKNLPGADTIS